MEIIELLKEGKENAVTRETLCAMTGMNDRTIRNEIERLRREYVILNDQDGKGYYLSKNEKEVRRYVRQEEARAKAIFYRLRPARELLKSEKKKIAPAAGTAKGDTENNTIINIPQNGGESQ